MRTNLTIEKKVAAYIKKHGIKRIWVAAQIGISPSHFTNMLCGRDTFPVKHIKAINKLLNTDFK
jgi:uncharacterized Fe-S cluster-containing radical SAM superfamily enzyme